MKKIIYIAFFCLLILNTNISKAEETDYRDIYMNMNVPTFSYVHGIDPGQYYDNEHATYSIYPLFRLNTPVYFKTIKVDPGYYLLTPVTYKGDEYLLFKTCGVVKYTIPVYKKEIVPEGFYESHLPQRKLTFRQKCGKHFYAFLGKHFKSAQRRPAVKSFIEATDLDNNFVSIVVYYGPYRYYTLFRTVQF